jgi:2-oxoglutarate dehydrogenase E2 component (dihydrolipoamide succinyltransferase)
MAQIELVMPKMGESVAEATIIKWLVEEGQKMEAEESVLEIATDKVDSEVPAPADGVLIKKMFGENDVVEVGQVIALIETEQGAAAANVAAPEPPKSEEKPQAEKPQGQEAQTIQESVETVVQAVNGTATDGIPRESNGRFYSPLVRSIAQTEGISLSELDALAGSGREGRVTKADILAYVANRNPSSAPSTAERPAPKPSPVKPMEVSAGAGDEIIEMDRMRKLIADHMVMSKQVAPHVTSFVEVDVTRIVKWRNRVKADFQKREGEKITFTPIFIEALVQAIKEFPLINVSVNGDSIIKKRRINIGMAAALPTGNLIVPVIHDADQLNLTGLTKKVNDLAARARKNELKPEEIQGGTYTLTNVGTFGNLLGTPIINQPQVAIMAAGAIVKKASVIETPEGDMIGIRHKMFLSHSYDHRVVDGALGGRFVRRVADLLEAFDGERDI